MREISNGVHDATPEKVVKSAKTSNLAKDDTPSAISSRHNEPVKQQQPMTFDKMGDWSLMTATR